VVRRLAAHRRSCDSEAKHPVGGQQSNVALSSHFTTVHSESMEVRRAGENGGCRAVVLEMLSRTARKLDREPEQEPLSTNVQLDATRRSAERAGRRPGVHKGPKEYALLRHDAAVLWSQAVLVKIHLIEGSQSGASMGHSGLLRWAIGERTRRLQRLIKDRESKGSQTVA
jgi:hypothetical protein